ncbi:MAG TPA: pyridoxamine 5'-phosphate oxidase family protein [Chloroflexota bacterium]|nr:pyridoxamine 5'-phosphate oxidase family protein [Chloroflexota bacterium]
MAESQPATPELRAQILEVIGKPIYPYLITSTAAGFPYSRPLICINDGFTIRMVTRASSRKMTHLRRNPRAALLWVDGQRSVLLQGVVSVLPGEDVVADFYRRYLVKNPARTRQLAEGIERLVLELQPAFCRADWFAGFTPVIIRF